MKYYQEITLLPNAEANLGFLWEKVYHRVHLALVENKTANGESEIGISFPGYKLECKKDFFPLGSKLRLFSKTEESLIKINFEKWTEKLIDYCNLSTIEKVPENISQYALFKRIQLKTNAIRLAKRRAKRKGVTLEKALEYYSDFRDSESSLPYINTVSLSSIKRNRFRLFILHELVEIPFSGNFNCYGLSSKEEHKQAVVPWF